MVAKLVMYLSQNDIEKILTDHVRERSKKLLDAAGPTEIDSVEIVVMPTKTATVTLFLKDEQDE